jgi:DNA polymerase-3 subunit epsilon
MTMPEWEALRVLESHSADPAMDPPAPAAAIAAERYLHLSRRAEAFVRDQGGSAPEDALINHVFGGAGSTVLWRPLLRQLLSDDDHLFLRADGSWTLNTENEPAPQSPLAEFVVVDVETTGLQPTRQRIIEIAIIHYRSGVEVDRFTSLLNPGRAIPDYIAKLTGINNELVAEAPAFAELASDVVSRVDGRLIVGHNVAFDIAFLNAELQRLNVPKLINERIDTMGLATRLVSGLRKPGLHSVAKALAVPGHERRAHRAAADATLTADVVLRLAALAHQQGFTTLDQLKGLGGPRASSPRDKRSRGRAVLDRSLLADIPKKPGVYLMRDVHGGIIYVGKAKNLRDRVSSYYSQPLGYTRKMDGLLESIARIDVEVAGCELEALMLESQLIRRYQPRYNTALRSHEHYPFIRVDIASPWPRVMLGISGHSAARRPLARRLT